MSTVVVVVVVAAAAALVCVALFLVVIDVVAAEVLCLLSSVCYRRHCLSLLADLFVCLQTLLSQVPLLFHW